MADALTALLRRLGALLYRLGLARIIIWWRRRSPRVLLYHACDPEEHDFIRGLRSNTTPATFARHLAFLSRFYHVVALDELESGALPDRAAIITFDDGYRSVYQHAFPLLRSRSWPATVYLVTDVLEGTPLVWVNELLWYLNVRADDAIPIVRRWFNVSDASPPAIVEHVRAAFDPDRVNGMLGELRRSLTREPGPFDVRLYVSWSEVGEMSASGITFGSHTASHPNLARLTAAQQLEELRRARVTIMNRLGTCTSLAYPFGNHDSTTRATALTLGHRTVMEVGGVNRPLNLARVARTPISAVTDGELFAELEVVAPLRAGMKRLFGRFPGALFGAAAVSPR